MGIDAIGIVTLAVGLGMLLLGPSAALFTLIVSTVLGAASALTVGHGSSVQPAYLLLCICALVLFMRDRSRGLMLQSLAPGQPGFWLVATAIYGAATAFILPRLFEGQAYVFAVVRQEDGVSLALRPLTPISGNFTQTVYLFGDVVAFAMAACCAATERNLRLVVVALLACASANLLLGMVDLAAYKAGLGDVLSFLRNANYRVLQDGEIVGFKRIVGAFPEASSYAYMTLGLFVFSLRLWLAGIRARWTGSLAALSSLTILLTTSTSGYVGLIAGLAMAYAHAMTRALAGRASRAMSTFLMAMPVIAVVALFGLAFSEGAQQVLLQLGEATILNKMSTQSGVERSMWNTQAIEVFFATSGFGAGLGSVRASSFVVALLANLGIIGAALYAVFLFKVLSPRGTPRGDAYREAVQQAARASCVALLASAAVSGGSADLGLVFCLLAGLASSRLRATAPTAAGIRNGQRFSLAAGNVRIGLQGNPQGC